jgi:hypothetical protein
MYGTQSVSICRGQLCEGQLTDGAGLTSGAARYLEEADGGVGG